ncbi:SDR family NAD(P)-dependent oxidoreductase [Haloimpatiens sp. FM7315]|uniref:SDR family NAD(P)-dependent oxidoreductase n=1 Tax=Haloimpatiens sp. FM7315 TaxID=3298609 RepID=UPI00370A4A19
MAKKIEARVLITGASSGIGFALAEKFAKEGYNLILISRREDLLSEISEKLRKIYGVQIKIIAKDLIEEKASEEIFNELDKLSIKVDILINNAGIGYCGFFHEIDIDKEMNIIKLNIIALTKLTKYAVEHMIKNRKGKILNVASTGAYQPGPLISVYYASKAYVLSFSEAIRNELKPYNITVTTLCPGTTKTEFSQNAGKGDLKNAMEAKKVAEIAYKDLIKGKRISVPGVLNKLLVFLSKITPRVLLCFLVRKIQSKAIEIHGQYKSK